MKEIKLKKQIDNLNEVVLNHQLQIYQLERNLKRLFDYVEELEKKTCIITEKNGNNYTIKLPPLA